jgi:hypothetical protein
VREWHGVRACSVLLLASLLLPRLATAADLALRAEGAAGVDTNPLREADETRPDGFVGAVVEARAEERGDRGAWRGAASIGGRLFARTPDANVLATRIEGSGALSLGRRGELTASLALRDLSERGGVRTETGGSAQVGGALVVDRVRFALGGGFAASVPRAPSLSRFASVGPEVGISALWEPGGRSSLFMEVTGRTLAFPRWDQDNPGDREDRGIVSSAEWRWRGPVVLALGYAFTANHSSVRGGDYARSRLTARAATPLPSGLSLAVQASLQRSSYPDGVVFTDTPLLLAFADEQQNALELRVSRPFGERLEIAVKAGYYASELSGGTGVGVPYQRALVQVGVGWRAE